MAQVTVVGAGVIGLSCAVRLAESGFDVDVFARDLPPETTSAVAGGLWMPFLAQPADEVARWARESLLEFTELASGEDAARCGVQVLPGLLLDEAGAADPSWAPMVADIAPLRPEPSSTDARGWRLNLPLVDTGRYLEYLRGRLVATGGTLTRLALPALPGRGVVVNCSGLASRALAGDSSIRPVRGQVVLLADPGLTQWWVDQRTRDGLISYVLPHGRHVVVGGSAEDGDWSTEPRPWTAEQILRRAVEMVPQLRAAEILGHRVGLRPVRPVVRLETEVSSGRDGAPRTVVHCSGHGGAGITLSWGCAGDVLAAVRDAIG